MRYRVLGPLEVRGPMGERLPLRGQRQRALLAALIVRADDVVPTDVLLEAMWGEDLPKDPLGALQTQMSRLRTLLGAGGDIRTEEAGYRLHVPDEEVDARCFERLVSEGRARTDTDPEGAVELLECALDLWRGPAYAEVADRPFAEAEASRLEGMRLTAAEERAHALLTAGRFEEAAEALEAHCVHNPMRERAQALLMRSLYGAGRQAEALEAYRVYRDRLADELGVNPGEELRALEVGILRQELEESDRRRTPARRSDVPVAVTSFVGREADAEAVERLLTAARVVTITGTGGVGKTRLALEVARGAHDRYRDGVVVLEMGSLGSDDDVAPALASGLEVQQRAGASVEDRIVEVLRPMRILLVLDNCEHVLDGAARLVSRVVTRTDGVRVLATSREPLDVDGEHVWSLEPLPLDEPDDTGAAVRLFLDRARASAPATDLGFQRDVVREVCRTLDGVPLPLELAAAQLRVMSLEELRDVLAVRTDVLAARRAAVGRHRSLDASIGWSYELLDTEERRLFERLAVFAGPFGRGGAEAVVSGDGVEDERVAPLLWRLVDRSMVSRVGPDRFVLLESMRRYGLRRLEADGSLSRYEDRHTAHVLELVEGVAEAVPGPREREGFGALDRDLAELRAVHKRLLDRGDPSVLALSCAVHPYAHGRLHSEVFAWAQRAAEAMRKVEDPRLPLVLGSAATGAWQRGDLAAARRLAEDAVASARTVGVPEAARLGWSAGGDVACFEGRTEAGRERYRRAWELSREAGDVLQEGLELCNQSLALAYGGEEAEALHLAGEARELARHRESATVRAWAGYASGEACLEIDPEGAVVFLEEALEAANAVGDRFVQGVAGLSALTVKARYGEPREALAAFPELIEHWRRAGAWTQQSTTLRNLVELLGRIGEDSRAARLYGAMQASPTALEPYGAEAARLTDAIGRLRERLGDAPFEEAVAEGRNLGDAGAVELALDATRGVTSEVGEPESASLRRRW